MVSVSVYLAVAVVFLVIAYLKFVFRFRREEEPPYVPGHLLWGNGAEFAKHAVNFLLRSKKSVGDIFTIRLLNQYMTMIMDPHCLESFSKEKNFSWQPITEQVNANVFGYELKNAPKMIKEAGKKVNGRYLGSGMDTFAKNLSQAMTDLREKQQEAETSPGGSDLNGNQTKWTESTLCSMTASTFFDAIFYTIFGRPHGAENVPSFTPEVMHKNFDIFHKVFNYLWLGLPIHLFPKAHEALKVLIQQPLAEDLMARQDCSEYIKTATSFMLSQDQTQHDVVCHNLIFMHVNYNTFRINFWCIYKLLQDRHVLQALREEMQQAVEERTAEGGSRAEFNVETLDKLPLLDSFVKETFRVYSGVFVVRKCIADTEFTMPDGKTYLVREGDRVAMYPPAHNMDPEVFEDPEVFKYDRFVDAKFYKYGKELKTPLFSYGTLCPGKRISQLHVKWYILNYLNSFNMELLDGEQTDMNTGYYGHEVLPPVNDVKVRFSLNHQAKEIVFVPRQQASC